MYVKKHIPKGSFGKNCNECEMARTLNGRSLPAHRYLFVCTLVKLSCCSLHFLLWFVQTESHAHCTLIKLCLSVVMAAAKLFLLWLRVWLACKGDWNASTYRTCLLAAFACACYRAHASLMSCDDWPCAWFKVCYIPHKEGSGWLCIVVWEGFC